MEASFSHQIRVGIFLTVGLIATGVSIFFLGGAQALKAKYSLKARFPQVQGLAVGSVVSLSGVPVGNVTEIGFVEGSSEIELNLSIEENFKSRITKGSTADIRTQGALGDKFIYVDPNLSNKTPMDENDVLSPAMSNDIISVLTKEGDRATKLFDILDDVSILTKTLTHENRIDRILSSVERSSKQVELSLSQTQKLSSSLDKVDLILAKIEKGEGTLGALINDPSLHDQLKAFLGGNKKSQALRDLMRKSIDK